MRWRRDKPVVVDDELRCALMQGSAAIGLALGIA